MARTKYLFAGRKAVGLGVCGAALLAAGVSLADELYALVATPLEEHNIERVAASTAVVMGDIGVTLRLSSALATADGTDLLLLGQNVSDGRQYFWRVGRTASGPAALAGPYQAIMGGHALLSSTAVMPQAAWVGTRHIAVATGEDRVTFYEPIERIASGVLAPATPDGWPASSVVMPDGRVARVLAAATPTQLWAADGIGAEVVRIEPAGTTICSVNGGGTVVALAGLPGGGAVAAMANGSLVMLPGAGPCGSVDPATSPEANFSFSALHVVPGMPVRLLASGTNGTIRVHDVSGSTLGSPVSANVDVGGAVAAGILGGVWHVLVGGVASGTDGYRLLQLPGLASVATSSSRTRVVVRAPDPAFGLSTRIVELDSLPAGQRLSLVRVYGAAGQRLRLYRGTCQRTSVVDAYDMGAQVAIGRTCTVDADCPSRRCLIPAARSCAPILDAGAAEGSYWPPSNDAILAFAQAAQGEDCQMVLAGDPAAGRGGGALIRVRGSTLGNRGFALVLDRSGSMSSRVDPAAAAGPGSEVRVEALRNAVRLFIDTVARLPDASQAKFAIIPFNHLSSVDTLPAMGLVRGDALSMLDTDTILTPGGTTNIRGALKSAADRLAAEPGLSERFVLLLTDGLHNVVGSPQTNSPMVMPDPVNNLEPPMPGPGTTSAYLTAPGGMGVSRRVNRLYAVGLSPMSAHPSLVNLVRHVNAPSSVEAIPPGYLDYSLRGNEVAQFFTKVLWGYLGASEFVDPIVTVDEQRSFRRDIQVSPNDRELIVAISWMESRFDPLVRLSHVAQGGMTEDLSRSCRKRTLSSGGIVTCYVDPVLVKSTGRFTLEITKNRANSPGELEVMVEVAGRSNVRLRTAFGRQVHSTGERMQLLATLTEMGLPIPPAKGGKVVGRLSLPSAALGTVLARLQVSAAQIMELRRRDPDLYPSSAAAKFALLPKDMAPTRAEKDIELFDDGKHGDGLAGDGVYGLEIDTPLPGIYRAMLRASYDTPLSGKGSREGTLATQVVVALDVTKSLVRFEAYQRATARQPGSFRVVLRPQDSLGNLLGPGNETELLFRQGDRTLPARVAETEALDGSYVAEVSDVRAEGPVLLVGSGGGGVLLKDPSCEPEQQDCNRTMPPADECTGCCCNVGGAGSSHLPHPLLLGLLGGALLLRRRRRERSAPARGLLHFEA